MALRSDMGVIISDIMLLIKSEPISVSFVSRKVNMVAHNLAKLALSSVKDCFWLEFCPPSMKSLVLVNCPC